MYTILTVDDAKDSILLLEFDLSKAGFTVLSAESGKQALMMLNEHAIDMVLLDIHMPEMSGLTVLKKIKENPKTQNIPVIMLSASDDEDEIVLSLELGAADHVTKPYSSKVLLARINTVFRLAEKQLQQALTEKTPQALKEQAEQENDPAYAGIDRTIGVNNVLGDETLFKQILAMFYEDHAEDAQKLQIAFGEQDIKTAKHLAHTLKGVASSIGAMALFSVAKQLDMAINQQEEQQYLLLTEQLNKELSIVLRSIESAR